MQRSPTRWTTALAAAALIALPGSALAQSNPTQNPPVQNPPTQNPPAQNPPAQNPPAQNPPAQTQEQPTPASGQADQAAAKQHLTQARDTLSQLTSMPEAAEAAGGDLAHEGLRN